MRFQFACIIAAILLAVSCSGRNYQNPASPGETPDTLAKANYLLSNSSHYLWGMWEFRANPDAGTIEITPLRISQMHLNVLPLLEPPAGALLSTSNLSFDGLVADLDISITHPFPGLTKFTGFDVAGILISSGMQTGWNDAGLVMSGPGETRLLNPDGYTRWWNPVEFSIPGQPVFRYKDGLLGIKNEVAGFTSTLNGYKLFGDHIGKDDDILTVDPLDRITFTHGYTNTRHYTIDFSGGLVFNYAIDANWAVPEGVAPYLPEDFPPDANRFEAWAISVSELENTLWNESANNGGDLILKVDVHDHFNAGENTVWFDSPGNFDFTSGTPVDGGPGFSTYVVEMLDATPSPDEIGILIGIESEFTGYSDVLTDKQVTAYFKYTAKVDDEGPTGPIPPTAIMFATTGTDIMVGDVVSFDATMSTGDPVLEFHWDFNGDGIYDGPEDIFTGDPSTPNHIFNDPGIFDVTVKVVNPWGEDISDPVQVNVDELPKSPTAVLLATSPTTILTGGTVDFDASLSTGDPVLNYTYDFNGDGTYDGPEDGYTGDMVTPTHQFDETGTFSVTLKLINPYGEDISDPVIITVKDEFDPDDIYVDADFPGDFNDGSMDFPFITIQEGMAVVTPGHTVHVDYFDQEDYIYDTDGLVLKSDVTLIGDNWNGGGPGKPIVKNKVGHSTIEHINSLLSNFTLEGFEIIIPDVPEDNLNYGINIGYWSASNSNITIRHNHITGDIDDTDNTGGICVPIYTTYCDNSLIEFNEIGPISYHSEVISEVSRVVWSGMYIQYSNNVIIKNNFVHDTWADYPASEANLRIFGIHCYRCEPAYVHNNLICHVGGTNGGDYRIEGLMLEGYNESQSYHVWNNTIDGFDHSTSASGTGLRGVMFYANDAYDTWIKNMLVTNFYPHNPSSVTGYYTATPDLYEMSYSTGFNLGTLTSYFGPFIFGDGVTDYPGLDPMYVNSTTAPYDYHFQVQSQCEFGDPNFIDWDDTGTPSGDPLESDLNNRSRMGCFGGPDGNWDPNNL